jgi:hypothetical protein
MMTMPVTNPTTSAANKQTHHHHDHHPLLANVYLFNNQGCGHLRDGHHPQALDSFKAAFATIKAVLIAHGGTVVPQTPPRYPRRLLPMSADVLRTHLSTTTTNTTMEEEDITSTSTATTTTITRRRRQEECHYFTFTNGIPCIPGHHFSTDLVEEGQIVSAIVLFNLAATTHLQASILCYGSAAVGGEPHGYHHHDQQYQQQQQQAALRSAQSLYFCASHLVGPLLIQQDQLLRSGTRHGRNAAFDLLSLALFNNIAITHWECREFLQADEAFARLAIISHSAHSSFGGVTGSSQSPPSPPQQNRDEALLFKVKSMLFNATVGGPVSVSIAPAA